MRFGARGLRSNSNSMLLGAPVMAQWLTNLTRNHEVVGSIPGLDQWPLITAVVAVALA